MSVTLQDLTREPDLLEKMLLYCERRNLYNCVSISVKLNKSLNRVDAFGSLRNLVLKYPLLFSFPVGEEPQVKFEPLEQILFDDVYEVNKTVTESFKDSDAECHRLTSLSFYESHKKKAALWKLVFYKHTNWLTLHSSHSFTDGGSVMAYLKDFVEGLNHVKGIKEEKVLFSLEADLPKLTYGISPGLFERVNYQPDYATKITARILKSIIYWWPNIVPTVFENERHKSFFVDCDPVAFSKETCFESEFIIDEKSPLIKSSPIFINFDSIALSRILKALRQHEVKLSSFLIIVYVHTIHQLYPTAYKDRFLKVGVPASFRNLFNVLQPHGTYLGDKGRFDDGFYTYGVTYFLDKNLKFSWEAVQKYHKFLHATVNSQNWIKEYYTGCKSMEAKDYMDSRFEKKGDCCFLSITNLGHNEVLNHDDPDSYSILDILFAPSAGATLGTHHMTISSTEKGGMNIGFANGDHKITDWNLFKKTFAENISSFSGTR